MLSRLLTWPKLLGMLVAGLGGGAFLSSLLFSGRAHYRGDLVDSQVWAGVMCLILFTGLGYPLYRGYEWARRTLLALAALCAVSGLVLAIVRFCERYPVRDGSPPLGIWLVFEGLLRALGFPLLLVSLPMFFVLLLCHPDVVAAFTRDRTLSSARKV